MAKNKTPPTGKEVCDELAGLVSGTESSDEIKVEGRTVATIKKKKAKGETIEFSEPLGDHRKQKVISAFQTAFSDTVMQTGVVASVDALRSLARLPDCQS